jgi:uncharacterized protein (TIGR02118 family)
MAKIFAMYKKPADVAAFEKRYFSGHVPVAKKLPGLRRYEVTTGPVMTPGGPAPYHMIAILSFDSMAALQQAMGSPEGQATAADANAFAAGLVDLLIMDTKDV